jgi:serine protease Do/serine protease DegQ
VALTPIGEDVEFKLVRDGKQIVAKGKVAAPFTLASVEGRLIPQLEGAAVANVERGMPMFGRIEGALVARVEANSPAWYYGLRPGDIIVSINRIRTKNIAELQNALRAAERNAIAVTLLRGDFRLTILIR